MNINDVIHDLAMEYVRASLKMDPLLTTPEQIWNLYIEAIEHFRQKSAHK